MAVSPQPSEINIGTIGLLPRDKMVVRSGGDRMYMWRAVDDEGEVLDMLVRKRRNMAAALKLLGTLLKNQGIHRDASVTDGIAS